MQLSPAQVFRNCVILAVASAAVVAAAIASTAHTGSRHQAASQDEWTRRKVAATAYMKAHPAAPRPGMYAGIVIAGDPPGSSSWILEVAAADGEWVEAQCGAKGDLGGCKWPEQARLLGAYVYVTSEGCCSTANADHPGNIQVIKYQAVPFTGMDGG